MSKRVTGRQFGGHNEAARKQLVTPVWVWEKEWITPPGVAQGSSYKVLKWVKTQQRATFDNSISGSSIEIEAEEVEDIAMDIEEDEGDVEPEADAEVAEGDMDAEVGGEGEASAEVQATTEAGVDSHETGTPQDVSGEGTTTIMKAAISESTLTVNEDPTMVYDTDPTHGMVELDVEPRIGVDGVSGQVFMNDSENPGATDADIDHMQVDADREGDLPAAVLAEPSARQPIDTLADDDATSPQPQPTVRPMPSNAVEVTATNAHSNQFGAQSGSLAQPGDLTFTTGPEADVLVSEEEGVEDGRVEMEGVKEPGIPLGEGDTVGVNGVMDVGDEETVRANRLL